MVFLGRKPRKSLRSPGFPAVRHSPRAIMCGFLHGKPHAVRWSTKLHRKSGFGLHQLRNCSKGAAKKVESSARRTTPSAICTSAFQQKQPAFCLTNRSSTESANYILQQPGRPHEGPRSSPLRSCEATRETSVNPLNPGVSRL